MKVLRIIHAVDADGDRIVTVPLTNSERKVIMLEKDLDGLIAKGFPLTWRLAGKVVLVTGKGRIPVARIMVEAQKGDRVIFKDKNPCNLLRSNIIHADSRYLKTGDIIIEHINLDRQGTETSRNQAGIGTL
jgi:hypothetical protein